MLPAETQIFEPNGEVDMSNGHLYIWNYISIHTLLDRVGYTFIHYRYLSGIQLSHKLNLGKKRLFGAYLKAMEKRSFRLVMFSFNLLITAVSIPLMLFRIINTTRQGYAENLIIVKKPARLNVK